MFVHGLQLSSLIMERWEASTVLVFQSRLDIDCSPLLLGL